MLPLLSVVIPTKNRYKTAVVSIRAALRNDSPLMEVVVQDCSENDALEKEVQPLLSDSRLKYQRIPVPMSMTDNWNRAVERIKGMYCIFIGDDDSVLPNIIAVASWASLNNIDAVQGVLAQYYWNDYPDSSLKGKLRYLPLRNSLHLEDPRSYVEKSFITIPKAPLANPYHGLISKKVYDKAFEATGTWFSTANPDCYFAIIGSYIINKYVVLDYPITISGASASSNRGRLITNTRSEHFVEYATRQDAQGFPDIVRFQWSHNIKAHYEALVRLGRAQEFEKFDMGLLYAACLLTRQSIAIHIQTLRQYAQYNSNALTRWFALCYKIMLHLPSKIYLTVCIMNNKRLLRKSTFNAASIEDAIDFMSPRLPRPHGLLRNI